MLRSLRLPHGEVPGASARAGFVGAPPSVRTLACLQIAALPLAGCSTSPTQNLLGSFFPAWMLCAGAGIVVAVVLRQILGALDVNRYLLAPPLTYLCMAASGGLLVWLIWFGH
jgi:hypothetical protein